MITWFWHQIVYSSFCCDKFNISMFSHVFHSFSENCIIHQLKSFYAFFLRSVFNSIHAFSRAFWLNVINLWISFKTNPWFSPCFKFLMCIPYSVLSFKLATSFSAFSIFTLSGKNGKSWWSSCNFSAYWTSTSRK